MQRSVCFLFAYAVCCGAAEPNMNCRVRSTHLRQDGGLCFEIPPWQHQPVELEHHVGRLREMWGNSSVSPMTRKQMTTRLALVNSEVSRYMDTVLAPFLDAYHRNIQNSYQTLTGKILRRIKEEINVAVAKKHQIYSELTKLADDLNVPAMCDEERRAARTVASQHVAYTYRCIEEARESIAKMGPYAEEMISITRQHMQVQMEEATKSLDHGNEKFQKGDVAACLRELSKAAANLGYELDLSVTNARRHSEHSCERLASCSTRARRRTDELVQNLRDQLYQGDVAACLRELSKAAANLGYELDLSVTNARRHSEHSCERLASCSTRARRRTDELVQNLRDQLYQCVYA